LAKEDHYADPNFRGVTYADVEVTTVSDATQLEASLISTLAIDLDFELRSADGATLIARSAGATASELISSSVQPNTRYVLRVIGWANGPADFHIVSDQLLPEGSPNENAGTVTVTATSDANTPATGLIGTLIEYTVNPLTGSVTWRLLE
jgi:hypothetical protein